MSKKNKEKSLNKGEKEEYLIKIYLCYLRDKEIDIPILGKIKNVGFEKNYKTTNWSKINFEKLKNNQKDIKKLSDTLSITKSSSKDKADVKINDIYYFYSIS